jgi:aspartyl-tRNA(Asn)/glutamyl-tRNA(Gln) amidotransferase subunit A
MSQESLTSLTLHAARQAIRDGSLSPVELVEAHLARIEALNPKINAYLLVTAETARAEARAAAERLAGRGQAGDLGLLHGLPIGLKDLYDVAGLPTTAGSVIFRDNIAAADSTVARRLRQAGAILLGKLNLHEWALGVTNINAHFGACRNPWALEHIPGGSSGGSAAALAAGLCLGSFGSDTGGSIRIPASLTGVVGLKPTYGRIGLSGVVPLAWSLDHPGPMARTVRDAALLLQAVAGYDSSDPGSSPAADQPMGVEAALAQGARGLRVGVPEPGLWANVNAETEAAARAALGVLESLGCEVRPVELPGYAEAEEASRRILLIEAAAYHRERMAAHADQFGPEVLPRFQSGAAFSGVDYALARKTQAEWRRALARLFETVDLLALPATPVPAMPLADSDALKAAALLTRFTRVFNLAGVPALSLPCGFTQAGLPIGLQIVGPDWAEAQVLRLGHAYETATDWHTRRPPL